MLKEFQCTYCRYIFRSDDWTPECPRCQRSDSVVIVADTPDERERAKEKDDRER